jgi:hypothetical protein
MRIVFELDANGELASIASDEPCEVYICQPSCPGDRVYLYNQDVGPECVRKLIGGYAIGHADDGTLGGTGCPVSPKLPPIKPKLKVVP